jgi:hypothetical protein
MKALIHYLKKQDEPGHSWLGFWCPGCKHAHTIPFINAPPPAPTTPCLWCFDGNVMCPTISPSLRVMTLDGKESDCHVVITKGILNYQADCKHELAGKSVPMEQWEFPPVNHCPLCGVEIDSGDEWCGKCRNFNEASQTPEAPI